MCSIVCATASIVSLQNFAVVPFKCASELINSVAVWELAVRARGLAELAVSLCLTVERERLSVCINAIQGASRP